MAPFFNSMYKYGYTNNEQVIYKLCTFHYFSTISHTTENLDFTGFLRIYQPVLLPQWSLESFINQCIFKVHVRIMHIWNIQKIVSSLFNAIIQ